MKTEAIANYCPKCHALLSADAPQGLCVKCLLTAAATPTRAGQPPGEPSAPPSLEMVASAFPQLEIIELIGHGGMGVVYKARQPRLDRFVALKLLPHSLAAEPAFAERFNREARVLARLNHPNIVTVHDFGESGGFFYLMMEFVDGVNLRQAMQAGRFSPQQALAVVPRICEALQFAHDEGILHRDIKPENILLDARGRLKIADFGIAKLVGEAREDLTLTASGLAVGSPHYMAPEQLEHPQDVDQRADIYSLGVVFYEMLTGELPIGRFAPPSQKSAVDPRVDEVVFHALEKEREKRYGSAVEVKTSVEAITSHPAAAGLRPAVDVPKRHASGLAGATEPGLSAVKPDAKLAKRPFWWTVSAVVFVVIGLAAVVDTLTGLYSRPAVLTFSPGLAHLFAGVAVLTLNRRWRIVALTALGLALVACSFLVVMMAVSPGSGTVHLPVLNLTVPANEQPRWAAAAAVCLALVMGWPGYLLLSAKARVLFRA